MVKWRCNWGILDIEPQETEQMMAAMEWIWGWKQIQICLRDFRTREMWEIREAQ